MAVFYWVGGYTGSTGPASGYSVTGNYWTNWITGLTSTIGDVFYSPYAWNVRENWRLEHTGQVQPVGYARVIRDSVPTRLPGGNDTVILGGVPAYLGTGPDAAAGSTAYYVENLAPHNFSILFGGMSGDGITSSGITAWYSGGSQPCALKVQERFTQLNKTWANVAPSWATTNGLTGLQIRTGEMGSWGLKYVWGDSRQGLADAALGRALALVSMPLNLIVGNGTSRASCYVNRKQSNLSVTGGSVIHIKNVIENNADIIMQNRDGYGDPFTPEYTGVTAVYGTEDTPASNHYLVPKGKWRNVTQGCGNTHLEESVEVQGTFQLGKNYFSEKGAVGHVVSNKTANVNRFDLAPSYVYGSEGNEGINIECYEQSAVPEISVSGWKNQSPFNCLTVGSLTRGSINTITYLETREGSVIGSGVNPRSAAGLPAIEFWRVDWPWSISNWFTGPIVNVRNVIFGEIDHQNGVIVPDPDSGLDHYLIVQSGKIEYPGQIIGKVFGNNSWKNFLIGYSPSDPGLIAINGNGAYTIPDLYTNPNLILPYDGMGIKLIK